jgi:hypothetical protein
MGKPVRVGKKARELVAALNAALPFEDELSSEVVAQLRAKKIANVVEARQNATEVSDSVVVCHLLPKERIMS